MKKLKIICLLFIIGIAIVKAQIKPKKDIKIIGSNTAKSHQSAFVIKDIDYDTAEDIYDGITNKNLAPFTFTSIKPLIIKEIQNLTLTGKCAPNAVVLLAGTIVFYDTVNVYSTDANGKPNPTTVMESVQLTCSNTTQNGEWSIPIKTKIPLGATDVRIKFSVKGYSTINGVKMANYFTQVNIPINKYPKIVDTGVFFTKKSLKKYHNLKAIL